MNELARWTLKVSCETDNALHTLLAARRGRKDDLSRFVEEAVNRAVFRETVRDVHERNADADPGKIEQVVFAPQQITEPTTPCGFIVHLGLLASGSYR